MTPAMAEMIELMAPPMAEMMEPYTSMLTLIFGWTESYTHHDEVGGLCDGGFVKASMKSCLVG